MMYALVVTTGSGGCGGGGKVQLRLPGMHLEIHI